MLHLIQHALETKSVSHFKFNSLIRLGIYHHSTSLGLYSGTLAVSGPFPTKFSSRQPKKISSLILPLHPTNFHSQNGSQKRPRRRQRDLDASRHPRTKPDRRPRH